MVMKNVYVSRITWNVERPRLFRYSVGINAHCCLAMIPVKDIKTEPEAEHLGNVRDLVQDAEADHFDNDPGIFLQTE